MAELRMLEPTARFILQGGAAARRAAGAAFGVVLPEDACRANSVGDRAALWLGPDEHLLLAPAGEAAAVAAQLASALSGIPHSLVEVSARQVAMQVSGPDSSELLNSGCPLDLDPAQFPPGMCTRTIVGKAEAVLWRKADAEYHLEVWRSFAGYVVDWLREAGGSEENGK
jgi:sarcosine oxidase, subunit gamma